MEILIQNTVTFVKEQLKNAESGHDWFHIERVWKNTLLILKTEKANTLICELAALLHDIADSKFHNGDEEIGPNKAAQFLTSQLVNPTVIEEVQQIIRNMSYKASLGNNTYSSVEMQIVQDADRLDAIGAIGIARAFNYGGFKNRPIYNPQIAPSLPLTKEEYKTNNAPTINHFYEKLLLLKDKMNTATAQAIAQKRHAYMEDFLAQFYGEWNGEQ